MLVACVHACVCRLLSLVLCLLVCLIVVGMFVSPCLCFIYLLAYLSYVYFSVSLPGHGSSCLCVYCLVVCCLFVLVSVCFGCLWISCFEGMFD